MRLSVWIVSLCLLLSSALGPSPASAAANTSAISGSVQAADGAPIADASVVIQGQVRMATVSDSKGAFQFSNVPTGLYTLVVSKAGFQTYSNDNVTAFSGESETVNVVLAALSFSSLRTIANITTSEPGVAPMNKSTAAISTISGQTFANQGQTQVTNVLNQTPGILTSPYNSSNGNPSNGDSPATAQIPQIRGALPYETESLIDGHPVSVGSAGFYSPTLINPWLLQDVELVKGPGSMPEEINYAVNGTVNYRTLSPTAKPQGSAMFGYDNWGGLSTGFKATGSTANHRLGYAFGYVTDGAPGPLNNFSYHASQLPLDTGTPGGPYYINGQQVAMIGGPVGLGVSPPQMNPFDGMGVNFVDPVTGCCYKMPTGYHATSELGKLLYNFSSGTSLTLSYLGGQSMNGNGDPAAYSASLVGNTGLPGAYFAPCGSTSQPLECNPFASGSSTYNCSPTSKPACNSPIPFEVSSVDGLGYNWTQQNLFQGEFRTTLGNTGTVLARYYTGSLNNYNALGASPGAPFNYSMNTYGTIPLCPSGTTFDTSPPPAAGGTDPNGWQCLTGGGGAVAPVNTTFNGQRATFSTTSASNSFLTRDNMSGETLELQELLGQNTVTLSYDRSQQGSTETADEPSVGIIVVSPADGSSQTFQTVALRGNINLKPDLTLNVGDYALNYLSHYSIDGGKTWNDSSHTYNLPRAALAWHPDADTSLRFSTGGSIAPPYISLVSSGGPSWSAVIGGVPAAGWMQNANNGAINAETAWSYDLGLSHRLERSTSIDIDAYFTQLHNLFLTATSSITPPSFGPAPGQCPNLPCLVSETENLGQARYEGVEFSLDHTPVFGLGWKLQGSLQRAFTYNLPPFFYCAGSLNPTTGKPIPPGPGCVYNTNLAVLPDVNFGGQPTALAGAPNGIASARVPYSLGYGEANWTGHYGQYYNLGLTYFGSNNSYNVPAFAVVSANARWSIGNHGTSLQISGDNLTNAFPNAYANFFNGTPLPLVKGAMGTNPVTGALQPVNLAATPQGNYGPASVRLIFIQDF